MTQNTALTWARIVGGWILLLPGVIAFQPVFGGSRGYAIAFVAVTVGVALGALTQHFKVSIAIRALAVVALYFVIGSAMVVPSLATSGLLPSGASIRELSRLLYQSWYDFLTVATPAGDFEGPGAVPLILGLVTGLVLGSITRGTRAVYTTLLVPTIWLGAAIAFGIRNVSTATWLGAAFGVLALIWIVAHNMVATRSVNTQILLNKDSGLSRTATRAIAALTVIMMSAGAAVAVNVTTADDVNRQVLRDDVIPPLNLHEYASPLMKYRWYNLTQEEDVLFRVTGMPEGARLRLAVLDTYDGNVFNVNQRSGDYMRTGTEMPWTPDGDLTRATIESIDYNDVWVPTFGESNRVQFAGAESDPQARGLYYNQNANQLITTVGFSDQSTVRIDAVPIVELAGSERSELRDRGAGQAQLANVERVPDVLTQAATDWTAEATSTYDQLDEIASRMRAEGFYSNGSDGVSRSGHTNERLSTMFNDLQWVGDDEQYATAMALMATQLGIPARVVMGFHPEYAPETFGDVWEVTGTQAHVWVEAYLDDAGWVSFDPTPHRDKEPQEEVPQPQPQPKPQVDPPPNPPEKLPDEPVLADEEDVLIEEEEEEEEEEESAGGGAFFLIAGIAAGSLLLLMAPFLLILLLKLRRAKRRRTRGHVTNQVTGAWDEVVDRARDMGHVAPSSSTRREAAQALQQRHPAAPVQAMAGHVDSLVFGPVVLDEKYRDAAWSEATDLRATLLRELPWYKRPRVLFSTRSLKKRRTQGAPTERKVRRGFAARTPAPRVIQESS